MPMDTSAVTRAAISFIDTHRLDMPKLTVHLNTPDARGWDPQEARPVSIRETVPKPPGAVRVTLIRSGPAFVAWCRALGASSVCVDRGRPSTTRLWVDVWRDGIAWSVVGLVDREHGAPHLPGADVAWRTGRDRHLGVVSVDGLATVAWP